MKALVITIFWVIVVGNYVLSTKSNDFKLSRGYKTKSSKLKTIVKSGKTVNNAIKQKRCRKMDIDDLGASGECNIKKLQEANVRSKNRAPKNKLIFNDIMNLPADQIQERLDKMTTKEWAQVLQQQAIGKTMTFERVIGGQNMAIKSQPSPYPTSREQFLYTINNQKPRYNDITKELDRKLTTDQRKQLADAMLQEMDKTASDSIDFAKIVERDKAEKASELIILTQIAEAVPGRTPGSDKDFRAVLRSIKESNGEKSFYTTIMEGYPPASQGGTGLQRKHADPSTKDYNDEELKKMTDNANKKNSQKGKKKQPNTKLTETEDIRRHYSSDSEREKRQTTQ